MQHFSQTGLYDTWIRFKNGEQFEMLSIQVPEFNNRSISSLIAEEISIIDDKTETEKLKSVRDYIISDTMFAGRKSRSMGIELNEINRLQGILQGQLLIDRWRVK